MVTYPLYKPQKGVDQVREGQGWSLVNLGTASHWLMDREAVARMSSLHWTWTSLVNEGHVRYTKGHLVHP